MKKFRVVGDPIIDSEGWCAGNAKEKLMIEVEACSSTQAIRLALRTWNVHPANYAVFSWDIEEEEKYQFKKKGGCWETCEHWKNGCHTKPIDGGPCRDKYKMKKEQ